MRNLLFNLRDPQFSEYHRAGLAGLVTGLTSLPHNSPVTYNVQPHSLSLEYKVTDFEALDFLLRHCFTLNDQGHALGRGLFTHIGFTQTLLQIPTLRKLIAPKKELIQSVEYHYLQLAEYRQQTFAARVVDKKGAFKHGTLALKGWILPGATGGTWHEEIESLLPLLFAPLAYSWFAIYSAVSKMNAVALVIPKIDTLQNLPLFYSPQTPQTWQVSSVEEAALNYSLYTGLRCKAINYAPVAWDKHQKNIRGKVSLNDLELIKTWREIHGFSQPRFSVLPDGRKIVLPSTLREMTARNLLTGKPLYENFVRYHREAQYERRAYQTLAKIIMAS